MRHLELLTAVLLSLSLIRLALPIRLRWLDYLPALGLVAAILQLMVEGYRWQMLPLDIFAFGQFLVTLPAYFHFPRKPTIKPAWRIILLVVSFLLLTVAIALPILLPIPGFSGTPGPFKVGTFSMELTDNARRELYSGNPSDPRRIMVQFWYPADPRPEDRLAPWMDHPEVIGPAMATYLGLPSFFLDHLKYVRSSAFLDAPVDRSNAPYPVLLFSHGWNGFRAQNTNLALHLASHGYIVIAIDHTFGNIAMVFPDGSVVYNNPQALPEGLPDDQYLPIANRLAEQWSGDMAFVLDTLQGMDQADIAHGMGNTMNLDKVGVFGHSMGGGSTVEFCARDARCKAGLGLDAYMLPVADSILAAGVRQPFLFMFSETWPTKQNWTLFDKLAAHSQHVSVLTIKGTSHYDYSDLPMLTPLATLMGLKGPLSGSRVMQITSDYPLAFFDSQFYSKPTHLLDGPNAAYPEVVFP